MMIIKYITHFNIYKTVLHVQVCFDLRVNQHHSIEFIIIIFFLMYTNKSFLSDLPWKVVWKPPQD